VHNKNIEEIEATVSNSATEKKEEVESN